MELYTVYRGVDQTVGKVYIINLKILMIHFIQVKLERPPQFGEKGPDIVSSATVWKTHGMTKLSVLP